MLELLVAMTCLFTVADTVADPDLWGHLTFGREILRSGQVIQQDRYSYLSDRPWINHEWLAEVIFASVYRAGGPAGLIAFKTAVGLLMLAVGFRQVRRSEMNPIAGALFLLLIAFALRPGVGTVRPQLFTYLLFQVLLVVLGMSSSGRTGGLWLLAPLFCLWVNCHGGVLAGLGVVIIWGLIKVSIVVRERMWGHERGRAELAKLALPLAACVSALAINPHGVELILFLVATATVPRPEISEWATVSFSSLPGLAYLALLGVSGCAWAMSRRTRDVSVFAVHLAVAFAPLLAVRHLPLFALATMTLAAEHVADVANRALARERTSPAESPRSWVISAVVVMILFMMILALHAFRGIRIDPGQFDFPVAAVNLLDLSGVEGNLMVDFDWGEYVIWQLGDRIKVSIDGRRETVYSESALRSDLAFREGRPGWEDVLRRGQPGLALLRRGSVSDRLMRQQPGWTVAYEDRLCSLFVRDEARIRKRLSDALIPSLPYSCDGSGLWFQADFPR